MMEQVKSGERAGYDARKGFGELLIDLIRSIVTENTNGNVIGWEMFCRNYYSITRKFIDDKSRGRIVKLMDDLNKQKYYVSSDGRNIFIQNWGQKPDCISNAAPLLMQLQEELIQATTHLLVPAKETGDEDFVFEGAF